MCGCCWLTEHAHTAHAHARQQCRIGKALTALAKEEDVLVIGSGLITHNLRDWRVFKKREVRIQISLLVATSPLPCSPVLMWCAAMGGGL